MYILNGTCLFRSHAMDFILVGALTKHYTDGWRFN